MDPIKATANESSTAGTTAKKNGRGERRRRWEMSPAEVRYFLPKAGTSLEHPELGREIPSKTKLWSNPSAPPSRFTRSLLGRRFPRWRTARPRS